MNAKQILDNAKKTGAIWLGGEMEINFPCFFHEAAQTARNIAENCGYIVTKNGASRLEIAGGEIPGYVVLDWFTPGSLGPKKVELWSCETAYAEDAPMSMIPPEEKKPDYHEDTDFIP